MLKASLAILCLLLAGCAQRDATTEPTTSPTTSLPSDLPLAVSEAPATLAPPVASGGSLTPVAQWRFRPGPGTHSEVSAAAGPGNGTVLLAWQEDIAFVWTALTRDAGATWTVQRLDDPAVQDPVRPGGLVLRQEAFDPTAAFGPDGTAYVLFGGQAEPVPGAVAALGGLTVARLDEGGWSFHHVDDAGTPSVWDAMHMAVAPDTGDLHVVAQSISHRTLGHWRSADRGTTWSLIGAPFAAIPAEGDTYAFLPRVAAGPSGLVAIAAKAQDDGQPVVAVSQDGGATFGAVERAGQLAAPYNDKGIPLVAAPEGFVLVHGAGTIAEALARGPDGQWSLLGRLEHAPGLQGYTPWTTSVAGPGGRLLTLQETFGEGTTSVRLALWDAASAESLLLREAEGLPPYAPGAGDEYGGLAIDPSGHAWAAWGDPEGGIRLVRVALG